MFWRKKIKRPEVIVEQVVGTYEPRPDYGPLDPEISTCSHGDDIWDDETMSCGGCPLRFR